MEISNSYKVKSRYDRQKICSIIENTGVTTREYDNMSSEWLLHNMATPIPKLYDSAHAAGINYVKDSRRVVSLSTDVLEIFGWE